MKPSILTRQDHIRHVDESDIEYYTPTDSDEVLGGFGFKVDGDSDDADDATGTSGSDDSEDDSSDDEVDENGNIIPKEKKKKKKKKKKT